MSSLLKVGVREFREHLQQYILNESPVAITRHGETVGYYIPTRPHKEDFEIDHLKKAAKKLEKLMVSHGLQEDDLTAEFRRLREGRKPS